ncbi:MAG: hypothetical protein AABZ35_01010 [Gemmatimonadota bacterium]|jgi:hypothetical protein
MALSRYGNPTFLLPKPLGHSVGPQRQRMALVVRGGDFVAGMSVYLLVYVGACFIVVRIGARKPGPAPVVE